MSEKPMSSRTNDPETYAECAKPFASEDEANAALAAFHDEVRASRKKHKLRDVLVVVSGSQQREGAEPGDWIGCMTIGNEAAAEGMAAYAYGQMKTERAAAIERFLTGRGVTPRSRVESATKGEVR